MRSTLNTASRSLNELFQMRVDPWRYRSDSLLEHVIRTQLGAAQRNITPVHFWRFKRESSGTNHLLRETTSTKRRYYDPIPAFIKIDHAQPQKPLKRPMVDEEVDHTFKVDLGECIRLGEYYEEVDAQFPFHFYLMASGDIYQWNYSLYQVSEVAAKEYYEPVQRFIIWQGSANLLRGNSIDPERPLAPLDEPPVVVQPTWQK